MLLRMYLSLYPGRVIGSAAPHGGGWSLAMQNAELIDATEYQLLSTINSTHSRNIPTC